MSLFKESLQTDASIADERDSVGSGGVLESNVYPATITLAYAKKSDGGALGLIVHFKTDEGREFRQTFWMTSGTAKGCKNYYEKDGEKHYLPGFLMANSLALLAAGKEISAIEPEEKLVNVYNKEAKAEVPTKVEALVELMGKEILVGLIKQTVDKTAKNAGTGVYEATGETRDENEADKFFRAKDRMTTAEIRAQATEATFIETWSKKWTGVTKNKTTKTGGTAGAPKAAGTTSTAKPTSSLFN